MSAADTATTRGVGSPPTVEVASTAALTWCIPALPLAGPGGPAGGGAVCTA